MLDAHDLHALQVTRLALALYDALVELHDLGRQERRLLEIAALLHDIGWAGGREKHHKRSYSMILDNPPANLTPRETLIVANVARYHRKALPRNSHDGFNALHNRDKHVVRVLAAILRVADGLDRTHTGACEVIGVSLDDRTVRVSVIANSGCRAELETAQEKADLFSEVFSRDIDFSIHHD